MGVHNLPEKEQFNRLVQIFLENGANVHGTTWTTADEYNASNSPEDGGLLYGFGNIVSDPMTDETVEKILRAAIDVGFIESSIAGDDKTYAYTSYYSYIEKLTPEQIYGRLQFLRYTHAEIAFDPAPEDDLIGWYVTVTGFERFGPYHDLGDALIEPYEAATSRWMK